MTRGERWLAEQLTGLDAWWQRVQRALQRCLGVAIGLLIIVTVLMQFGIAEGRRLQRAENGADQAFITYLEAERYRLGDALQASEFGKAVLKMELHQRKQGR